MRRPTPLSLILGAGLIAVLAISAIVVGATRNTSAQMASPAAGMACPAASPEASPMAAASPVGTMSASPEEATPTASGCEVTIDLEDIKFVPNDITIPANTPVKFILHNAGALPHDFSVTDHNNPNVKDLGINVSLDPGETKDVTINAPAGDYYFYCNVPGHEEAGMHGMLHVK